MRSRDVLLAVIAAGAALTLLLVELATPPVAGSRLFAGDRPAHEPAASQASVRVRAAAQASARAPFVPRAFPKDLVAVSRDRAIGEALRLVAGRASAVVAEPGMLVLDLGPATPTRWVWEVTIRGALPRGFVAGPEVPPLGLLDGTRVYVDAETGRPLLFGPDRVIVDATGLRRTLAIELELRVPTLDSLAP